MDFLPEPNWQWVFDKQRSLLTLEMNNYVIDIVYKHNMLVLPNDEPLPFTVEDVARYIELFENPALNSYQDEFSCRITLHIMAIELFHKPLMPKSWLFTDVEPEYSSNISLMSHVILTAKGDHESANYLVIEDAQAFSLCLLIDHIHQLTPRKSLPQFQIIKVTSDKLSLVTEEAVSGWDSFQSA